LNQTVALQKTFAKLTIYPGISGLPHREFLPGSSLCCILPNSRAV